MLKAVIFDMDGVLLDSEPLHMQAIHLMLKKIGIKESDILKDKLIGADYETMWNSLIHEYNIKFPINELLQMQCDCSYEYFKNAEIEEMQGLSEFIADLKKHGIYIAVGSSSPVRLIELVLKRLDLLKSVDTFCGIEYVCKPKPAPDIFLRIAKELRAEPEECLVIEDSPIGIMAAKRAGMKCMALCNPHAPLAIEEEADGMFMGFSEMNYRRVKSFIEIE